MRLLAEIYNRSPDATHEETAMSRAWVLYLPKGEFARDGYDQIGPWSIHRRG